MLSFVTAKQVGLVGDCGVDGGIHAARSVFINTTCVRWIVGTVESVVRQPPQSTSVEQMDAVVVR